MGAITLVLVALFLFCGCSHLPSVPSIQPTTRGATQFMPQAIPAQAVIAPPQKITRIHFAWNHPNLGAVDGFVLCLTNAITGLGEEIRVGKVLHYTFVRTNWPEAKERHWYSVKATWIEDESVPSNKIPWPLFPPDRMHIGSSAPTTLEQSEDLRTWTVIGSTPITVPLDKPSCFYRGISRVTLITKAFNPLNEQ